MRSFYAKLNKETAIDLLYERVISECERFFDVPNSKITFCILFDNIKLGVIAIFRDEDTDLIDSFDIASLNGDFVGYHYVKFKCEENNSMMISANKACLPRGEIRYIKFDYDRFMKEVGELLCNKINDLLGTTTQDATLQYDPIKEEFLYQGQAKKCSKELFPKHVALDLSSQVLKD